MYLCKHNTKGLTLSAIITAYLHTTTFNHQHLASKHERLNSVFFRYTFFSGLLSLPNQSGHILIPAAHLKS